jgi:hypothetical protein
MKLRILLSSIAAFVGLLVPIAAGQMSSVLPAAAAGPCTVYYGTGQDGAGFNYPPQAAELGADASGGSLANIVTRPATWCSGGNGASYNSSSAWSMILPSLPAPCGNICIYIYAQTGFIHSVATTPPGVYTFFAQYNNNGVPEEGGLCDYACVTYFWPGSTNDGNVKEYWEDTHNGEISLNVNSTNFLNDPVDPYTQWYSTQNEFAGEVDDVNSDIPGNGTDGLTTFSQMTFEGNEGNETFYSTDTPWYAPAYYFQSSNRAGYSSVVEYGGATGNSFVVYCLNTPGYPNCTP